MNDTPRALVDPREGTYFAALLAVSVAAWGLAVLTCVPAVWAVGIGLILWLANGLLAARLRAEAIEVTPTQLPALHQTFTETCARLGLAAPPRLFVLQQGGALNAFATRHAGRDFVAVFSDMLEACGTDTGEMRFVLGHEIGHIRRNHLWKNLLLAPGRILPLLGNAYARACERTCDLHGARAAGGEDGAARALMMLAAGREAGRSATAEDFARQYEAERGFFVSWHELASAYPSLSHRVANLLAHRDGTPPPRAKRHPLAYVFGLFTLSGPGGAAASLLVTLAVLFLLLALATPALRAIPDRSLAAKEQTLIEAAQERGTLDRIFVGTWKGGVEPANDKEDFLRWTTVRKPDGELVATFEERTGGVLNRSTLTGQWRVLDGDYFEIYPNDESRRYRILSHDEQTITLTDDPDDPDGTFVETRLPEDR